MIIYNNSEFTKEYIEYVQPNEIFVFGSNSEGRHGSGSAKMALRFGAVYGQSHGLQGNSYGIETIDLRIIGLRSVSLEAITKQVQELINFAKENPDKKFLVTKIGSERAGYTIAEIAKCFDWFEYPKNIILPKEFVTLNGIATELL